MKILALEFSSAQRSVAVWNPRTGSAVEVVETAVTHAMKPFAMIEAALRQSGLEREQIEGIAVGLGPGSYTGIRAAIALAQGWQLARGVRLAGVSSVEGIAAQAAQDRMAPKFTVVIDAQRGEFYLAGYEVVAHHAKEVLRLRIAPPEAVRERARAGEMLIGPEVTRWFPEGHPVFPRAAVLARLASERIPFVSGDELEPIYLRETNFVKAPPPRIAAG